MKKFLMVAIAVFMMAGTAAAVERVAVVENNVTATENENIADRLIALMKDYTNKANDATSMDVLEKLYAEFETTMADFAEKNAAEIAEFEANITDDAKKKYEAALQKATERLTKAFEKKALQFMGE